MTDIVLWALGGFGASIIVVVGYVRNMDKTLSALDRRVAVKEQGQDDILRRLERIEYKVDRLMERK